MGFFADDDRETINILLTEIQPAHLQISAKRKLTPEERDSLRAEIIRSKLKGLTPPDFGTILKDTDNNDEV